ncbi:MAG: hypothetical protein UU73_C0001G0319 [Candidatus Daviesbacteria bacterium GW2011_GWA1_41_61]|uniref:Uncharacterized protein n=1 Tax=Candidatus Daviesbacteria bacterium GW2011_GWA2_40_9 TaxID=1618424 RepID=A0A0G0U089_9BACT|nr:MAG: hypothetical protein UU26_C0025G0005 [Candidatus Daviesbacteria bacterium GW2011_GWC1_40_9]KKR82503.1 MAG: hypothetical protein UU29_C0012G0041 [Candidatus Daviesbacteria bacterium GW2011_GWA2_40_9]KKR93138.1 MAG: hypothetical protein UU44_C0004G0320 [Candidatus Daviesbacteria bacterium GW2011_GWB1_41_15]KKS15682.1 MAG: hypothetical protein UU73_C0001G0319 [Candidatus Daviesbacteria bacterium GW2011_GWA1_41_61]
MSYSQSKKLTDTEKKLQSLRAQLYGKDKDLTPTSPSKTNSFSFKSSPEEAAPGTKTTADTGYLRHDLLKILLLASLMIGAQVALYFSLKSNFIKF